MTVITRGGEVLRGGCKISKAAPRGLLPVVLATKEPGHVEKSQHPPVRVNLSVGILANPGKAVLKVEGTMMMNTVLILSFCIWPYRTPFRYFK